MYVLRELLESLDPNEKCVSKIEIHLQDYNNSVLQLVTLPNMLLTWCTSLLLRLHTIDLPLFCRLFHSRRSLQIHHQRLRNRPDY